MNANHFIINVDLVAVPINPDEEKLRYYFQEYYSSCKLSTPDLLSSREIGYIPFGAPMVRHRSLRNLEELRQFVNRIVPRHFYYSTAYYRNPENKKMSDKGWLGAELIFDLDADHIKGAEKMRYDEILSEVKKHTERLIFDHLMDSLGFARSEIRLYFSGGRGYHVHIYSDKVYSMDSDSRREIANFIRGEGLDQKNFIWEMRKSRFLSGGWLSLIDSEFVKFHHDIDAGNSEAMEFALSVLGNRNTLRAYVESLKSGVKIGKRTEKRRNVLTVPGPEKYKIMDQRDLRILGSIIPRVVERYSSEIDEPVTTDIHRLIRFPYSLHGKTGLAVVPVQLDELEDFEPLRDAIPHTFVGRLQDIKLRVPLKMKFMDSDLSLDPGNHRVDLPLAIFAVSQRMASFY